MSEGKATRWVNPFDLTLVWPLWLKEQGEPSGKTIREIAGQAWRDHHWEQVCDLVRRNGKPEEDGFAFAEMVYFHPFVQHFFYGSVDETGRRTASHHFDLFQYPEAKGAALRIHEASWQQDLVIQDLLFHAVEGNMGILTLRVTAPDGLVWENALNVISKLRTTYFQDYRLPPNIAPEDAKKHVWMGGAAIEGVRIEKLNCGEDAPTGFDRAIEMRDSIDTLRPRILVHWRDLLKPLLERGLEIQPLGDHRIPVMAFLGLEDLRELSESEWFALSQADDAIFPKYAPEFRMKALQESAYDRWWDPKSPALRHRYLAGPMTYLSVVGAPAKARPSYIDGLQISWRRQHYQLFLLAHYQRAALLILQHRITLAASHLSGDIAELLQEIGEIQKDVAVFSSGQSFREISPQIQGQELYTLLRKQLDLDSLYDDVIGDKALLANSITAREELRRNARWEKINRWVIPLGLSITFLAADLVIRPLKELLFDWIPWFDSSGWAKLTGALAVAGVVIGLALLVWSAGLLLLSARKDGEKK